MININDYNREDLIASCLMEAANIMSGGEVLTEGAANKASKRIKKQLSEEEAKCRDYFNGALTQDEGREFYKKAMYQCDKFVKKIKEIPNEEFSDKFTNTLKMMFSPGSIMLIALYAGIAAVTGWSNILIGAGLGDILGSTLTAFNVGKDANKVGRTKNWTKVKTLSKLNSFRASIISTYNKYYR